MRLLAVDWGMKRIGVAVGECEHDVVTPRSPITPAGNLKKDAANLVELARNELAQAIVLGLPLEPGGTEGRMAKIARMLAVEIEQAGMRVELVDETLTSVQAETEMAAQGIKASRRRKLRDGEAACIILERFLHGKED
jgi:putative Holliday junction resolvase